LSNQNINEPMLEMYLYETMQILDQLEQAIMANEKQSSYTEEAINEIFRFMHTIKGSSAMMLFNDIAGSYTPFCLLSLSGAWKWSILSVVWTVAILGITSKILWIDMPRWLSTLLYIGMGWIALFALKPLYDSLTLVSFLLLVLGGVMYTIGGVIYAIKKPNISKSFGFHELFHIFCILGSACHYLSVLNIIL
jgi:channel protein (hemolysin III family)